jgi:hypothetical protein
VTLELALELVDLAGQFGVGGQSSRSCTNARTTRECVLQIVDFLISGQRVVNEFERLSSSRQLPKTIVCYNGPELTSNAMFLWSQRSGVKLHFIQPWQADAERVRRELQRQVPRVLSRPELVHEPRRCATTHRMLARALQPRPTASLAEPKAAPPCLPRVSRDMFVFPHRQWLECGGATINDQPCGRSCSARNILSMSSAAHRQCANSGERAEIFGCVQRFTLFVPRPADSGHAATGFGACRATSAEGVFS